MAYPLEITSAVFDNGKIVLNINYTNDTPSRVYISPVIESNGNINIKKGEKGAAHIIMRPLSKSIDFSVDETVGSGIKVYKYIVHAAEPNKNSNPEELLGKDEFLVSVPVGKAEVQYWVTSERLTEIYYKHSITLKSNCKLMPEMILYSFTTSGKTYEAIVPGVIGENKIEFAPFFTVGKALPIAKNDNPGAAFGINLKAANFAEGNIKLICKPFGLFKKLFG